MNIKLGDLVRVRDHAVAAVHHGKIGVVVAWRLGWPKRYDVLLDGGIAHFYGIYLEIVDAAR
jgi:hypothetical protein